MIWGGGEFSESFAVEVGVRQGCVMSPWLFNMFMAPERLRNPFNADQRVDIYSLGALGIYMFSGKYILEVGVRQGCVMSP